MGAFIKVLASSLMVRMRLIPTHTSSHVSLRCFSGDIATTTVDIVSQPSSFNSNTSATATTTATSNVILPGHIYFVATPIGNLLDISERAKQTLLHSDFICAEDTRHTRQLLNLLKIKPKQMLSHHEHNYLEQIPKIIDLAKNGNSIAIVSDAGTPGISDPGSQLAQACFEQDIPVHPVPGPSAVVAALSVCGFPSSEFSFFGFIDVKGKERAAKLSRISSYPHTAVFFEAPHRIVTTLTELVETYKQRDRECVYCREVTKLHEEIVRAPLHVCLATMKQREDSDDKVIKFFSLYN